MAVIYPVGVYKDNSTLEPDYSGCSDSLSVGDFIRVTDDNLDKSISSYFPEVMKDTKYDVFTRLLSERVTQLDGISNFILECYNFDIYDDEMVYKLSSLLNINYPLDYSPDRLSLLVKNYIKLRKIRGEPSAIYKLLRILERSETELYLSDEDDTSIIINNNGDYIIHNSRIENTDFAEFMISKIIQSGLHFIFDNDKTIHRSSNSKTIISESSNTYDPRTDSNNHEDDEISEPYALILDRIKREPFIENYPY